MSIVDSFEIAGNVTPQLYVTRRRDTFVLVRIKGRTIPEGSRARPSENNFRGQHRLQSLLTRPGKPETIEFDEASVSFAMYRDDIADRDKP